MQSWYKTWQHSGSSHIRAKQKLHRKPREACKSSWSPIGSPKSFIHAGNSLEFGKACEELTWNHCTSTPLRSKTNAIDERAVRRIKAPLLYCRNQVWMKNGGQILWNAIPICETSQTCYLMGRRPMKDVLGSHLKGPIIPFGAMVENHPFSAKDTSRLHQFGPKALPGIFIGYVLYAGGIWKRDILVADIEELREMDAPEFHAGRLEKSIDDYWHVDGDRELSDTWTGFTRFTILNEMSLAGYTWSGERVTRKQTTSRPYKLWPEMWKKHVCCIKT